MGIDFSLWCDFIHRDFLDNEFIKLVDSALVNGATSNPSIFSQALKTPAYTQSIATLKHKKLSPKAIYEELALNDIKRASEILYPLFASDCTRGFISIEIDPRLAHSADKSIQEGKRLYKRLQSPNIMIKVPATNAGYEVMNTLAKDGISVNATLVFSPTQAKSSLEALNDGYNQYKKANKKLDSTAQGVISVFVSRFDRAIESALKDKEIQNAIYGKLGIMNAITCYEIIESYSLPHIRTLFASTGVKSPTESMGKAIILGILYCHIA